MSCENCGAASEAGARFCSHCGALFDGETLMFEPAAPPYQNREPSGPHSLTTIIQRGHFKSPLFVMLAMCCFLMVLGFALGQWLFGLFLAPVAVVLTVLWGSAMWDDLEPRLREAALETGDALWRSARVVRVSLTSWSRAGKVEVRMRARQHHLSRQRDRLFHSLGEAVFEGDEKLAADLTGQLAENSALVQQNDRERQLAWDSAGARVEGERSATAPTEMFETSDRARSHEHIR